MRTGSGLRCATPPTSPGWRGAQKAKAPSTPVIYQRDGALWGSSGASVDAEPRFSRDPRGQHHRATTAAPIPFLSDEPSGQLTSAVFHGVSEVSISFVAPLG